ncbi:MAG: bifunctional hydroxymethylpyrimidine kinase/phosphomethylpyrimidine kinase [Rickettsiaceae bacterium H1]|nr:bifunctional hydroxymethylpyrimidine kinase/phosphomethylpyrimidine kinase [Rickettsiaceae bacterium H1]
MKKKILSIAGSDSSGGAGIQADISTIVNLGGMAMTAITAVTAQDKNKVYDVHFVPLAIIAKQIEVTIGCADAVKIGMLGDIEIIRIASSFLTSSFPVVLDPVMCSTSGYRLLSPDAIDLLKNELLPKSLLVTPNIPEAELLTGFKITNVREMISAGRVILKSGPKAVLVKGGHLIRKNKISDVLVMHDEECIFVHNAINAASTHGTGCKLSAAIACNVAQGKNLKESVSEAIDYVSETLKIRF